MPPWLWCVLSERGEDGAIDFLRSGIPWQMLPHELGWDLIHFALLDWLARSDQNQASLIGYTTPEHGQAPVAAAGQITTAGDARQLQLSLKVVF